MSEWKGANGLAAWTPRNLHKVTGESQDQPSEPRAVDIHFCSLNFAFPCLYLYWTELWIYLKHLLYTQKRSLSFCGIIFTSPWLMYWFNTSFVTSSACNDAAKFLCLANVCCFFGVWVCCAAGDVDVILFWRVQETRHTADWVQDKLGTGIKSKCSWSFHEWLPVDFGLLGSIRSCI